MKDIDKPYAVVLTFHHLGTCRVYIAHDNNLHDAMLNVLEWDHVATSVVSCFNKGTPVSVTVCEPRQEDVSKDEQLFYESDELMPVYDGPIENSIISELNKNGGQA